MPAFVVAVACSIVGAKILKNNCGKGPTGKAPGLTWTHWDVVGLRTTSSVWNVPGKYGPHGELFFFLIKKEPFAVTRAAEFKPFVLAETLKACALIGLHLMAAEGASASSSSCDAWNSRLGGPRHPLWKDDDVSWSGCESASGCEVYEHNNQCRAIEVIGQDWSSEGWRSFSAGSLELPHGLGPSLTRNEGCMSR